MKYNVYLYPTVVLKVEGIEAESQEEACRKAEEQTDLHAILDRTNKTLPGGLQPGEFEWAEELREFHVDEVGDEEYLNSHWYKVNEFGEMKRGD